MKVWTIGISQWSFLKKFAIIVSGGNNEDIGFRF